MLLLETLLRWGQSLQLRVTDLNLSDVSTEAGGDWHLPGHLIVLQVLRLLNVDPGAGLSDAEVIEVYRLQC